MLTVQTTRSEQLHENFVHAIACQIIVKNEASFSECSIHNNYCMRKQVSSQRKKMTREAEGKDSKEIRQQKHDNCPFSEKLCAVISSEVRTLISRSSLHLNG